VDAASDLARGVETLDGAARAYNVGILVDLQATHAVVDHWSDDGDVERLRGHRGPRDDVVVELLSRSRWAAGLVPRLARRVRRVGPPLRVRFGLLGRLVVLLMGLLEHRERHTHIIRERFSVGVKLHHASAGVVLAVPDDFLLGRLVEAQPERRLVLPHLTSHVVPPPQLVGKAFAFGVEHDAAHAPERLCSEELNLRIGVVGLYKAGGMHLHPLQIDGLGANGVAHLDAVSSAMLPIRGGQVHEVWPVLGQQRIHGEVGAKSARRKDHRSVLLELDAAPLVSAANAIARRVLQQPSHAGLGDDARHVARLGDLLHHLDQGVRDRHAREALLPSMGPRLRVTSKARDKREVKIELVHEPLDVIAAVRAQYFRDFWLFRSALHGVVGEDLDAVLNAQVPLRPRVRAVDAARGLRRVTPAEGRLVKDHNFATPLHDGVRGGHAAKATAHHDGIV